MAEPHVITALVAKRAELAGEIVAAEKRLDQMRADLAHLDGALRIFGGPAPETIAAKPVRTRCAWFGNGELARWVLDTLRDAPGPMTAGDIARAVMAAKGLDAGDRVILERVTKPHSPEPAGAGSARAGGDGGERGEGGAVAGGWVVAADHSSTWILPTILKRSDGKLRERRRQSALAFFIFQIARQFIRQILLPQPATELTERCVGIAIGILRIRL